MSNQMFSLEKLIGYHVILKKSHTTVYCSVFVTDSVFVVCIEQQWKYGGRFSPSHCFLSLSRLTEEWVWLMSQIVKYQTIFDIFQCRFCVCLSKHDILWFILKCQACWCMSLFPRRCSFIRFFPFLNTFTKSPVAFNPKSITRFNSLALFLLWWEKSVSL